MLGAIGALTLILQIGLMIWDRSNPTWRGFHAPTPLWQVLVEWAIFMGLFIGLSWALEQAWRLACLLCE
jgi:hypothetical protein